MIFLHGFIFTLIQFPTMIPSCIMNNQKVIRVYDTIKKNRAHCQNCEL